MIVRFKNKEYNAFKLVDAFTIQLFDKKNKKKEVSTFDVEIYVNQLKGFHPFEAVYGDYLTCDTQSLELREKEP